MKIRNLLIGVILTPAVLLFIANCATEKEAVKAYPGEYSGLWINKDYNTIKDKAARIIYHPDGTWTAYDIEYTTVSAWRGTISITDKWKDNKGNYWYKVTTNQMGYNQFVYELWKLDKSCTKLEGVWSFGSAPGTLNSDNDSYTVYFRQDALTQVRYGI